MDPIDMLGGTRGLYLAGYGTVFTTELSLIVTPGNLPVSARGTRRSSRRRFTSAN